MPLKTRRRLAEGERIQAPKAPSGLGHREGCPLPSRLQGMGSVMRSPAGSRAEPRPETHFGVKRSFLHLHI